MERSAKCKYHDRCIELYTQEEFDKYCKGICSEEQCTFAESFYEIDMQKQEEEQ